MKKDMPKGGKRAPGLLFLLLLGVAGLGLLIWKGLTWFEGQPPEMALQPEVKTLGPEVKLLLQVKDGDSGLRSLKVQLVQGELKKVVLEQTFPGSRWHGGTQREVELPLTLTPKAWGFMEGPAVLQLESRDYSWRHFFQGNPGELSRPVTIDLTPLRLSFISGNEFLYQGGTGLVVYQVNKPVVRSGLLVNDRFFAGYPLPGMDTGRQLVYFAMPYDSSRPPTLELVAEDASGQIARVRLLYRLKPQRWRQDRINLSDAFLTAKMPEFQELDPELRRLANPLEVFLRINQQIREKNHRQVQEICAQSQPHSLWQGTFLRLPNSKPMARFADHRIYLYQGREVDRQVHLGQDLASLERSPVPAANHGLVVFAGPLGIYGQTVILDHGQGIFSMYSHLSEMNVEKGRKVAKGEVLGRTGTTGLAGGDHLHFSMIVQGDFVNPIEWWDPHWLKDQVYRQLSPPKVAAAGEAAPPTAAVKGRKPARPKRSR